MMLILTAYLFFVTQNADIAYQFYVIRPLCLPTVATYVQTNNVTALILRCIYRIKDISEQNSPGYEIKNP
jgi:hypothetical protein